MHTKTTKRPEYTTDEHLLGVMRAIADRHFDGHFTIMKFSTGWRASFSTPSSWNDIQEMPRGADLLEAVVGAIAACPELRPIAFPDVVDLNNRRPKGTK